MYPPGDTWVLYMNGYPERQGHFAPITPPLHPTNRRGELEESLQEGDLDISSAQADLGLFIPSGGEFVLGQSSRVGVHFDISEALDGDLSHLNIWNTALNEKEVRHNSCLVGPILDDRLKEKLLKT